MRDGSRKKSDSGELRCFCGSLFAKWVDGGLELKCKRCKRVYLIPFVFSSSQKGGAEE